MNQLLRTVIIAAVFGVLFALGWNVRPDAFGSLLVIALSLSLLLVPLRFVVSGLRGLRAMPPTLSVAPATDHDVPATAEPLAQALMAAGFVRGAVHRESMGQVVVAAFTHADGTTHAAIPVIRGLEPYVTLFTLVAERRLAVVTTIDPNALLIPALGVVRQRFPRADVGTLVRRHGEALAAIAAAGCTPSPAAFVDDWSFLYQRRRAAYLAAPVMLGLREVWRRLRGRHPEYGPIAERAGLDVYLASLLRYLAEAAAAGVDPGGERAVTRSHRRLLVALGGLGAAMLALAVWGAVILLGSPAG